MYQKKPGVFMADWWDANGKRHRKQFANSAAAREHEHRETALAHAERASREMKLAARTGGGKKARTEAVTATGTIEPAKGKLGVMIPGMGAVATTFVAGRGSDAQGAGQADRVAHADGNGAPGKAHRRPVAEDQGVCSARRARRSGLHRLGHFRRQHVRGGAQCRRAGARSAGQGEAVSVDHHAA